MNVPEELRKAAAIYEQRNTLYRDNYKKIGRVAVQLFPKGITLMTDEDFNRFGLLWSILIKVTRYVEMFHDGGHDDSLDDITVYSQMLKEVDTEAREARGSM